MWKTVKLGEVCNFQNGRAFKKTEWSESGLPIIRIQNLQNKITDHNFYEGEYDERIFVANGDLLLSWSGTVKPFIWCHGDALLNQHVFKVSVSTKLLQGYAFYVFQNILDEISKQKVGIGLQHITKKTFENFAVTLPPLAEQQRIVAKLDAAFAEIEILQRTSTNAIQKVTDMRKKRLVNTFQDLTKSNEERQLDTVCSSMHQGLNTQAEKITLAENGIPLLQTRNVQSEELTLNGQLNYLPAELWEKYRSKYAPKVGDVFFTNRGTIGKTAICEHDMDAVVHWNIFKLTPDENLITPEFLLFSLQYLRESGYFFDLQKGTTVSFVSTKMMKEALIPCPNLESQKQVCELLKAVEGELARLELLLDKKEKAISHLKSAILAQELQPPQSEAA